MPADEDFHPGSIAERKARCCIISAGKKLIAVDPGEIRTHVFQFFLIDETTT